MRFENLLTRSARIIWRKPWLWLLALLAGETYGGGGGGGGSFTPPTGSTSPSSASASAPDFGWVPGWINDRLGLFLEVGLALLLLGLLLFLVSCLAQGALIGAVARLDAGERVGFGESWRIGARSFWRVLGFKVVLALLVLLPLLALAVPPLVGAGAGGGGFLKGVLLDAPLLVLVLCWIAFLGAVGLLGLRACVLDGRGPIGSYRAGWDVLVTNFSRVALTGLVLAAVGFGVGIVLQVLLAIVWVPLSIPLYAAIAAGRWSDAFSSALTAVAVTLPVSLLLSSAAGAYFATAWTVAYRRFGQGGEIPEPPPLAA